MPATSALMVIINRISMMPVCKVKIFFILSLCLLGGELHRDEFASGSDLPAAFDGF
jgi:hypothetical protein